MCLCISTGRQVGSSLSFCLSVCLSLTLLVLGLSVYLTACICQFVVCLFICIGLIVCVCLSICLYICLTDWLTNRLSVWLAGYMAVCLTVSLSLCTHNVTTIISETTTIQFLITWNIICTGQNSSRNNKNTQWDTFQRVSRQLNYANTKYQGHVWSGTCEILPKKADGDVLFPRNFGLRYSSSVQFVSKYYTSDIEYFILLDSNLI